MTHEVTCPDCGLIRIVTGTMASMIRTGRSTGRCKPCGMKKGGEKRRKPPKVYKVTCPTCGDVRAVSAVIACQVRKGKHKGLCGSCTDSFRKSHRNSGQFKPGHTPANKPDDPMKTKEKRRIYKLKWRQDRRDHVNAYFRDYYQSNLESRRLALRISKLKRRGGGEITPEIARSVLDRHRKDGRIHCYICRKACENLWEFEHMVPVASGGTSDEENLRVACRSCNRRKSSKSLEQFLSDLVNTTD